MGTVKSLAGGGGGNTVCPAFTRHTHPYAKRSGHSFAGTAGSNAAGGMDVDVSVFSVACDQADVSAMGRSLILRGPTVCVCVTECTQV